MSALIVKSRKPRNPLVAAALKRRAGRHGPSPRGIRRADRRALQKELNALGRPGATRGKPPSP